MYADFVLFVIQLMFAEYEMSTFQTGPVLSTLILSSWTMFFLEKIIYETCLKKNKNLIDVYYDHCVHSKYKVV